MNQSNQPVRFIIIGAGHIGSRHLDLLYRHPDAEVAAVIDTDVQKADIIPAGIPFYSTIEDWSKNGPEGDIASICTPNGLHAQQAIAFLEESMHVLIEKPMALNSKDCRNVLEKAASKGKKVFCVLQNRYTPTAQWLHKCISEKKLGDIYMVKTNCFWNRDERYYNSAAWRGTKELDGGTLYTQFSHFVDLVYWLFGDWEDIYVQFSNYRHRELTEFEDSGDIQFRLKNGAMGTFSFTTAVWDKNMESSITVIGEKGVVKVGGQYMDRIEYCNVKGYEHPELPPSNPPNNYGSFQGSASNHMHVFDNVIRCLQGRKCEATEGRDACGTVMLIEKIYGIAAGSPVLPSTFQIQSS